MNWTTRFQTASRYLSLLVLALGGLVLLGWLLNITFLKSLLPGLATMKANTAFSFVLSGLALYLFLSDPSSPRAQRIGPVCALVVLLIGSLTLCQYLFSWNLGIDELVFKDPDTRPENFPGRPSPITAFCLVMSGASLLLLSARRLFVLRRLLAGLLGSIGLFSVIAYLYGVTSLYHLAAFSTIAVHTAATFLLLSLGVFFARPDEGFMRMMVNDGPAGILMRRLFPASFLIPTLTGWVILRGQDAGFIELPVSLALFAVITIATFVVMISLSARQIYYYDLEHQLAEQQFKTLFDQALDVILVVDGQTGQIRSVSGSARRALGYQPDDLIGQPFSILFPDQAETNQAELVDKLRTAEHVFLSQEFARADGSTCTMDLTAAIIPWKDDRAILVTLRDVSERKLLEAEIHRAERLRIEMEKEREVTQLKEDFITMVSHDFRTPLAVIMTSQDMLERYYERLTQQRRVEQLQKIRDQVYYMTGLLDDVLLLGKARAQKLEFSPAPIDLKKVCWSVFDAARATDDGLHTFHFNASGQFAGLTLDEKLIRRILSNLLANAVKYSPDGGIIRLELLRDQENITLRVSDQGIGIPEKDQTRLFEPFHRGGNTSGIVGTGLGLAIVRESVQIHGGTIRVQSDEGSGSTFTICLPVR